MGTQAGSLAQAQVLLLANRAEDAAALVDEALAASPLSAEGLHLKALCTACLGEFKESIAALTQALDIREDASWRRDLGAVLFSAGEPAKALCEFRKAWSSGGEDASLFAFCGHALLKTGAPRRALQLYERASGLSPGDPALLRAQAMALLVLGRRKAAITLLERACQLDPDSYTTHEWIARAYVQSSRYDLALRHRRLALTVASEDRISARKGVGHGLWLTGQVEECLANAESLLADGLVEPTFHFSYVSALDHTATHAAESRQAWENWTSIHCHPTPAPLLGEIETNPARVLRIGYLVDEIQRVPDWHFIPPLLENRDLKGFETFCYLTLAFRKNYPAHLSRLVQNTLDLRHRTAAEIANRVAGDSIDILVNANWSQRHLHLPVFSHRPAPIQIELPVYPATTGLSQTDFIFSDAWICPLGSESMYTEKVCRLDDSYMPWRPPLNAPPVSRAPIETSNTCTFGFFQKPIKLNPALWDAIAEVLKKVPDSRLLIHQNFKDLDDRGSETACRYLAEMRHRGVDTKRLIFVGRRPARQHYQIVARADIALDSFPYNGTTTTGDCLWMGVPVVTFAGETHAGRVGLSMLARVGLEEFAACSIPEYIHKAVALANNRARLLELRSELRPRMEASVLTDGRTVMAGIERAYRELWIRYCNEKAIQKIEGTNHES